MEKRVVIASVLASITFVLALTNGVANTQLLIAGIGAIVGISTIVLAVAAFAVALRRKSYIVGGLLVVAGIVYMIPALAALGDFSVIIFPGPILGVIFGLLISGLGAAKLIGTARAPAIAAR